MDEPDELPDELTGHQVKAARVMYRASLQAMKAELSGLLSFAAHFRSVEANERLIAARELIQTELDALDEGR